MRVQGVHGVEERGRGCQVERWEWGSWVSQGQGKGRHWEKQGSRVQGKGEVWELGEVREWSGKKMEGGPTLAKTTEPSGMAVTVTSEASRVAR